MSVSCDEINSLAIRVLKLSKNDLINSSQRIGQTWNLPVAEFECGANGALVVNAHVAHLVVDAHRAISIPEDAHLQVLVHQERRLVPTGTLPSGHLRSVPGHHCGTHFVNF